MRRGNLWPMSSSSPSFYYGVRLINIGVTRWFDTEAEQLAYAARCGFEHVLCWMPL